MSLRLVYGKAGTGKSTWVFNEIKENINNNIEKYIITPEQFSFSAEKNLLNILETKSLINAEVLTFDRMAERISEDVEGKNEVLLTKSGKAMLIYSILEAEKNRLTYLKNNTNNIELVMQAIKEFKKHGISNDLLHEIEEHTDNMLLKTKLNDLNAIYNDYQNLIETSFIDEEDKLTKLAIRLEKSKMFENSEIYIDEFSGFTKQEYSIIKQLLKKAKRITVVLCMDNVIQQNKETDIFYSSKETWFKLKNIVEELGVEVEDYVVLENSYKFKNEELVHLEKNLYNVPYKSFERIPESIKISLLKNPYKQMEYVASEIVRLVRDKGYKYKDIAIITKNIKENASLVKAILRGINNIPVFIDDKEELGRSIAIKYILSILEIFASNWSQEAVMSYIKSGLVSIEQNEIFELENYVIKWGIRGSKWYKEDWIYEEENPNELRIKIVNPLLNLKRALEGGKNAVSITTVLYDFLEKNNIYTILKEKIETYEKEGEVILANNLSQSIDTIIDVMNEMVKLFGEEKMSFGKYQELLKVGLSYKELGNIPEVIDQVILGDVNRTRSSKIKVAFVIGVNDGIFPSVNNNEGFLNDNEREMLKNAGAEIAKGTLDLLYEEQFNIYKALTIPEEKLYLLYTTGDKEQKALRPSIIISKVKKNIPKIN